VAARLFWKQPLRGGSLEKQILLFVAFEARVCASETRLTDLPVRSEAGDGRGASLIETVIYLGMPRSCSTSIEKYLGHACGDSFLGKDIENSFAIPMLDQLIRRDIFLLNRDAFFEKYPPGWLNRKIVALGIPGGRGVLCDEELSIGGVMHLGQQTASFAEILFRL
jgi:hypothetical protein